MARTPVTSRNRRGFTMIELLTVIGIIVILMAILVPVISTIKRKGQSTDTLATIEKIANGCHNYYQDFRAYPGPVPDYAIQGFNLSADVSKGAQPLNTSAAANVAFPTAPLSIMFGIAGNTISSSENGVLGLLGGLRINPSGGTSSAPALYDPTFVTKGPSGLNPLTPSVSPPYLEIKNGDLTDDGAGTLVSNAEGLRGGRVLYDKTFWSTVMSGCSFVVPEFQDRFSMPLPIIYMRARPGAQWSCDIIYSVSPYSSGSQYYSGEMIMYAPQFIGQTDPTGQVTVPLYPPYSITNEFAFSFFSNSAANSSGDSGSCRNRDSFILLSAGPDGVYGTRDDIFFGN